MDFTFPAGHSWQGNTLALIWSAPSKVWQDFLQLRAVQDFPLNFHVRILNIETFLQLENSLIYWCCLVVSFAADF